MSKYTKSERNAIYRKVLPMIQKHEFVCNPIRLITGVHLDVKGEWFKENLPELWLFNNPDSYGNFYLSDFALYNEKKFVIELILMFCIEMTNSTYFQDKFKNIKLCK